MPIEQSTCDSVFYVDREGVVNLDFNSIVDHEMNSDLNSLFSHLSNDALTIEPQEEDETYVQESEQDLTPIEPDLNDIFGTSVFAFPAIELTAEPFVEATTESVAESVAEPVIEPDLNDIFSSSSVPIIFDPPSLFINDEPEFEAKPEAKSEIKPEVKPEAKSEIKSEIEPEVKPEAKSEIKPEVKPEPTIKAPLGKAELGGIKPTNTVKVDLARLDRLNNQIGELVTQENGAILQIQQLQGIVNVLTDRFTQFERTTKGLQDLTDKSQNARARLEIEQMPIVMAAATTAAITAESTAPFDSSVLLSEPEFDPLQMDSYSELNILVQSVMEEMAQFSEGMRDMMLIMQQAQQTQQHKKQTLKQVRNDLLWVRMFPLGDSLQRYPRMVRDMAKQYQKQVSVKLSGTNTLVDKAILDKLNDPLIHLVRNAFDHGVELPADRQAQGKSPEATIEIRAYYRGNQTYIEVRDDGRGIDLERIKAKAIALNLTTTEEAKTLSNDRLHDFLFAPGFSTASKVSELSGRGVGLDTVRSQIRLLKGGITIHSELGKGTTFTMRLPLTLTVAKLLVCSIGSNLLALPMDSLVSIISIAPEELTTIQGKSYYRIQDQLIPVHSKDHFLNHYRIPRSISDHLQSLAMPQDGKFPLLLITGESDIMALPVDHILQEQELVIKPFGSTIKPPPYLYGCTILGDGSLVPVIDTTALMMPERSPHLLSNTTSQGTSNSVPGGELQSDRISSILVVDDSLTARHALCATLKKAGYHTLQARDGREALSQLQQNPHIQAIFCDVEMPNMNGFEFLTHCRQGHPKSILPVIMVTSRSGEKHRQIATVLGATDYLTKPFLEQDLIKTLKASLTQI
jgi:two-component system, chemotaxis family, sensor histidine kinase and response regulator PixL